MINGEKVLIGEGPSGRLFLYWDEWKSNKLLHLRYWYCDKKDGVWKPGLKGIAVPEDKIPDLLAGLRQVLDTNSGAENGQT